MNTNKFGKYRSVYDTWYTVPTVYMLEEQGANMGKYSKIKKVLMTYNEAKAEFDKWKVNHELFKDDEYDREAYELEKEHGLCYKEVEEKGEADKTLAIIQFYGNKALVGWRNNDRCTMGMTRLCPIINKGKKSYLLYRGRKLEISHKKGGWVL
jgi:hypothetical protein